MGKWIIGISVVAVVALAAWFGGSYYCNTALKHRTEIGYMKTLADRIRQCKPDNVKRIIISDDIIGIVELDHKRDYQDIERLMSSLKQVTVENRECSVNRTGTLIVYLAEPVKGYASFRIDGDFNPDHSPIITRSMRSDDLGTVVRTILLKKTQNKTDK